MQNDEQQPPSNKSFQAQKNPAKDLARDESFRKEAVPVKDANPTEDLEPNEFPEHETPAQRDSRVQMNQNIQDGI